MGPGTPLSLSPSEFKDLKARFDAAFPDMGDEFLVTSPKTEDYNCIAWAAGENEAWWWPSEEGFWPSGATRAETIPAFFEAFGLLGYETCNGAELEVGFEKVALYARAGKPTHMARQLESGEWTSKLGTSYDISHRRAEAVFGYLYGDQIFILRRLRSQPSQSEDE